jgi:hypothetical protein
MTNNAPHFSGLAFDLVEIDGVHCPLFAPPRVEECDLGLRVRNGPEGATLDVGAQVMAPPGMEGMQITPETLQQVNAALETHRGYRHAFCRCTFVVEENRE